MPLETIILAENTDNIIRKFIENNVIKVKNGFLTRAMLRKYYKKTPYIAYSNTKVTDFYDKISKALNVNYLDRKKIYGKDYYGVLQGYCLM